MTTSADGWMRAMTTVGAMSRGEYLRLEDLRRDRGMRAYVKKSAPPLPPGWRCFCPTCLIEGLAKSWRLAQLWLEHPHDSHMAYTRNALETGFSRPLITHVMDLTTGEMVES